MVFATTKVQTIRRQSSSPLPKAIYAVLTVSKTTVLKAVVLCEVAAIPSNTAPVMLLVSISAWSLPIQPPLCTVGILGKCFVISDMDLGSLI